MRILVPAILALAALSTAAAADPLHQPNSKFWTRKAPPILRIRFETSQGPFVIETHREWAPIGVDRLYNLARAGFFNDSRLYRIRAGFIAQFGIAGNPQTAQVWRNRALRDDPPKTSNTRGRIAFAMTGPDTRTTQLFISLADNSRLDKEGFAPLGEVVEGMDVVDRIYSGYGEESGGGMRTGKQAKLFEEGNAFLDREYPKLDKLLRAVILPQR